MTQRAWSWVALLLLASTTTGAQRVRLTLAIARLDGHLVPFAAYDDGLWERAWPAADEFVDDPTLENIPSVWQRRGLPIPKTWHVWPTSGARPVRAQLNGIDVVEAHCQAQVALKTDLPPAKGDHPQKYGVALDSNQPLTAIEARRPSDETWRSAARAVVARFSALEARRALSDRVKLPH